jgi:hypothetical protein
MKDSIVVGLGFSLYVYYFSMGAALIFVVTFAAGHG